MFGFLFRFVHKKLESFVSTHAHDILDKVGNFKGEKLVLSLVGTLPDACLLQRAHEKHKFKTHIARVNKNSLFCVNFYVVIVENNARYNSKRDIVFEDYQNYLKEYGIHPSQWGFLRRTQEIFDAIHIAITL